MLDTMELDFIIFKLRVVGRKHLTAKALYNLWIKSE